MKEKHSEQQIKAIYQRCVEEPTKQYLKALFIECVILPNLKAWIEQHGK